MKTILPLCLFLFFQIKSTLAQSPIVESTIFEPTAKGIEVTLKGNAKEGWRVDVELKLRVTAPNGVPVRVPVAKSAKIEVIGNDGKFKIPGILDGAIATTAQKRGSYYFFEPTGKGKFITFGKTFRLGVFATGLYEVRVTEILYQINGTPYTFEPTIELYKKRFEIK